MNVRDKLALKRLARHAGVAEKDMRQRLILQADDAELKTLELDTAGWDDYFGVTR